MKTRLLILAGILFAFADIHAQALVTELEDPHPTPVEVWNNVASPRFGWGTTDIKYKLDDVPVLAKNLSIYGWRGEKVYAQAVLATPVDISSFKFSVSNLKSGRNVIPASAIDKYFETYVMGEVEFKGETSLRPDRLVKLESMAVPGKTIRPVWLAINIPKYTAPGKYKGNLTANCDGKVMTLPFVLEVGKNVLPEPETWKFHLDLWQNPYAVARYFDVPLWSKAHFDKMRPLYEYLASAGQKVITTSIIQHPWNSQTEDPFESMIGKFKGLDGSWKYDYTIFDKWVEFMMSCGITEQIDCYSILPWHLTFEYFDSALNCTVSKKMDPGSKEYEDYLLPFLSDFAKHLRAKGWMDKTCIAMDEPSTFSVPRLQKGCMTSASLSASPCSLPNSSAATWQRATRSPSTPVAAPSVPIRSSIPALPNQPSWAGTPRQPATAAILGGPTTAGSRIQMSMHVSAPGGPETATWSILTAPASAWSAL